MINTQSTMSIPLFLKVRPGENSSFECQSPSLLSFQGKQYRFSAIYENDIPDDAIEKLTSTSSVIVLIGPTGSGKTTTLKSILERKLNLHENSFLTVCEVKENRQFIDLLDNSAKKKFFASVPLQKQLKKHKLSHLAIQRVFETRETSSTEANPESSRSCLIVNVHEKSHITTIVDMMGNEKFSLVGSASSTFANTNVSSITQLLLSKTTKARSSNLVTNLIFNLPSITKIKFILHLNQSGSAELIKSSLNNIVDVIKNFRVLAPESSANKDKKPLSIPNYAKPTAASTTPRKNTSYKVLKPIRSGSSPTQSKVTKVITVPRNVDISSKSHTLKKPRAQVVQQKIVNKVTQSLYEEQIKRLKESQHRLEEVAKKQANEFNEYREKCVSSVLELKSRTSNLKLEGLAPLVQSLKSSKDMLDQLFSSQQSLTSKLKKTDDLLHSSLQEIDAKNLEIEERQMLLKQLETSMAEMKNQHMLENQKMSGELDRRLLLISSLEETIKSKSEIIENLNVLLAGAKNQLDENQTALDEKLQIMTVLESDLQHKEQMLRDSRAADCAKEKAFNAMKIENDRNTSEIKEMNLRLTSLGHDLQTCQNLLSEKEKIFEAEMAKAESTANLLTESRKTEQGLKEKNRMLSETLDGMNDEKEVFSKKHTELVNYNKYIVEKYTGVLLENEKTKQELEIYKKDSSELARAAVTIDGLKAELRSKTEELKSHGNNSAKVDGEMEQMELQYQQTIEELKRENETLKQSLVQVTNTKKAFNTADIIDDSNRKDFLKLVKKNMKTGSPTKANVLKESNIATSEKKKIKRRASSYNSATKSPKLLTKA